VVGFVSHASVNQLVDQMGQMSINHTCQLLVLVLKLLLQSLLKPLRWIGAVHATKNPQQPGGKKKEKEQKKIPILRKGLPPPKTPRREALRRKGRVIFPAWFVGRTTLLTSVLGRMRSIDFWHNKKAPQQPVVLTHPFPPQPQNMVATNPSPLQGGMEGTPHHEGSSLNASIFMCDQMVNLQTEPRTMTFLSLPMFAQKQHLLPSLVALFRLRSHILMHHFTPQRVFFDAWHIIPTHGHPQLQYCGRLGPGTLCHVCAWSSPKLPHAVEILVVFHRWGWSLRVEFDDLWFFSGYS
jgi:hypothetical protein